MASSHGCASDLHVLSSRALTKAAVQARKCAGPLPLAPLSAFCLLTAHLL